MSTMAPIGANLYKAMDGVGGYCMQDIIDSLRANINERLNSPLMGAYIVSWLVFNFRVPMIIFSDLPVFKRIDEVQLYLYGSYESVIEAFLYPFVAASLFVLVYPLLSLGATVWTHLTQNWTAKAQQVVLRKRVVLQEKLDQALDEWEQERQSLRTKLHEAEARTEAQRERRERAEIGFSNLSTEAEEGRAALKQLNIVTKQLSQAGIERSKLEAELEQLRRQHASVTDEVSFLKAFIESLMSYMKSHEDSFKFLQFFAKESGRLEKSPGWLRDAIKLWRLSQDE